MARVVASTLPHLDPRIEATVISQWYPGLTWYEGRRAVGVGGRLTTAFNRAPRLRPAQRRLHVELHPLVLRRSDAFIVEGDVRLAAVLPHERTFVRFHNWVKPAEEEILGSIRPARVITVGRAMADRLLEHMPQLAGRLEIVGGAVDTDLFHPPVDGTGVDMDSVVYVGRIAPEKGILELLTAFRRLLARRPRTHLLICGGTGFGLRNPGTDYLDQVRAEVDELSTKWPGSLNLLGPVDHERELPAILRGAAVGVFPSVGDEAMPLAVLEAMSSGLPVVASNFGGLSEAVGDAGALVDPSDPDEMASALYRLLEDRESARALGQRARDRVCSQYTWTSAGRQLSEVVMSLPG